MDDEHLFTIRFIGFTELKRVTVALSRSQSVKLGSI